MVQNCFTKQTFLVLMPHVNQPHEVADLLKYYKRLLKDSSKVSQKTSPILPFLAHQQWNSVMSESPRGAQFSLIHHQRRVTSARSGVSSFHSHSLSFLIFISVRGE